LTKQKAPITKASNNNDTTTKEGLSNKIIEENIPLPEEPPTEQKPKKVLLTIANLQDFLASQGVYISYDIHKKAPTIFYTRDVRYDEETMITSLIDQLRQIFNGVSRDIVSSFLDVIALKNKVDLVMDKIFVTYWDKVDRLPELYSQLHIEDDPLSQTLLYKWLCQCMCLLQNKGNKSVDRRYNMGAEGILVFNGKQGIGKTSFFRELASIVPDVFKEGGKLTRWNKDHEISSLNYWITELGEIESSIGKNDIENIKQFATRTEDEIRLPYGHKARKTPRTTSLCGTCNSKKFLRDVTGNRRFWIIPLPDKKIDRQWLETFDFLQLWSQIFTKEEILMPTALRSFRLTEEEEEQVNERNKAFELELKGECEVADILSKILRNDKHQMVDTTVTEWKGHFPALRNIPSVHVGRALSRLGYERKSKKVNGDVIKVLTLPV